MRASIIEYKFGLGSEECSFSIDIEEPVSSNHFSQKFQNYPDWTNLSRNQCPNCPLKEKDCTRCPAAVRVHDVLETFKGSTSFEKIELTVTTNRRIYKQSCDLQSALNSMLGLQMATSGCPILEHPRAMATFHIPFCTIEETLY